MYKKSFRIKVPPYMLAAAIDLYRGLIAKTMIDRYDQYTGQMQRKLEDSAVVNAKGKTLKYRPLLVEDYKAFALRFKPSVFEPELSLRDGDLKVHTIGEEAFVLSYKGTKKTFEHGDHEGVLDTMEEISKQNDHMIYVDPDRFEDTLSQKEADEIQTLIDQATSIARFLRPLLRYYKPLSAIPLDLRGWYEVPAEALQYLEPRLYAEFVLSSQENAFYDSTSTRMILHGPYKKMYSDLAYLQNYMQKTMPQRVRHEMQHYAQNLMEIITRAQKWFDSEKGSLQEGEHDIQDVEFDPVLADEIIDFKRYMRKMPEGFVEVLFPLWVGARSRNSQLEEVREWLQEQDARIIKVRPQSDSNWYMSGKGRDFFALLKKAKPKQWKKAVKILAKALKMRSITARGKAKKDVGYGGLDEWFSGHGGDPGDATWGDWISISPVERTIGDKKIKPGDIVGPCGISSDSEWSDLTNDGKDPLKCMPRQKAYDMSREERAELAKVKFKAEQKDKDQNKKPTMTPTFTKKESRLLWRMGRENPELRKAIRRLLS